jgi:hypothetical protein
MTQNDDTPTPYRLLHRQQAIGHREPDISIASWTMVPVSEHL